MENSFYNSKMLGLFHILKTELPLCRLVKDLILFEMSVLKVTINWEYTLYRNCMEDFILPYTLSLLNDILHL